MNEDRLLSKLKINEIWTQALIIISNIRYCTSGFSIRDGAYSHPFSYSSHQEKTKTNRIWKREI